MAVSYNGFDGTNAPVATPGTSVAPALAPPDNCTQAVLLNPSTTATVYFALASPGGALSADTSGWILPSTSISIAVGTLGISDLVFDATGAVTVRIVYVNGDR